MSRSTSAVTFQRGDDALELLGQLLDAPGRPLPATAVLQAGPDGHPRLVRRRVTCCLNYTVAGQPCATCPLLPASETRRRLLAPA